eukprot:GHVQ01024683.1.p1 GENE.GHVQ01024683.1~~GHVQ01024683.1.p1  ORF type:complete len:512 (-),score=22.32 GHVQ01024683.1:133-1668(-)
MSARRGLAIESLEDEDSEGDDEFSDSTDGVTIGTPPQQSPPGALERILRRPTDDRILYDDLDFLRELQDVAKTVNKETTERLSFANISWSRQPSFNEYNLASLFQLVPAVFYDEPPENVRLCEKGALKRIRDVAQNVAFEQGLDAESQQTFRDFWRNLTPLSKGSTAFHMTDDAISLLRAMHRRPSFSTKNVDEIFDLSKDEFLFGEDNYARLQEAREIVGDLSLHLQEPYDSIVPNVRILSLIYGRPCVKELMKKLPNPQSLLSQKGHDHFYWIHLCHRVWMTLVLERFNVFDGHHHAWNANYKEPLGAMDHFYLAKNVPRMARTAQYMFTGMLECRVPGVLRLLSRLNTIHFFEERINWTVSHCGGSMSKVVSNVNACRSLIYNMHGILLLWPYLIEWPHVDLQDMCPRIWSSPFTTGLWRVVRERKFSEEVAISVHLIVTFMQLLTEITYGSRPAGFIHELNFSPLPSNVWMNVCYAIHEYINIFFWPAICCCFWWTYRICHVLTTVA